ncbi:sugar ABC transporter permease [Aurantimonas endophytica]|uniref:Xylose transport system permease protein XylH n=1 Tax=Aurantimonas endophytica TaxID=1522175 RepID=A0A7W6HCY2_9HYPH|nr:sugar ABC transporter permease [Aurantimonas endophytica]MBB4002746.1 D-xylose transport system permease protein [Aurantimonas endophytica]MCO6403624.1 sugar ABC transporter permease [Aurantimonas endophytica]
MSQATTGPTATAGGAKGEGGLKGFIRATEIDTRMLGMVGALLVIWVVFHFLSGGIFLTPRNLWNLTVQTASIAVMATGMVLVIVTRNIDLSVGSILGFTGMAMAALQVDILPGLLGFNNPFSWIITLAVGVMIGIAIGGLQGYVIAFLGVPAFIVTLGGLLVWRGGAWWLTSGRTVAPLDDTFRLMGGGATGSLGETWTWILALVACVAVAISLVMARRRRVRFGFPLRPVWAEATMAAIAGAVILGAAWILNSYHWPSAIARRYAEAQGIEAPEGGLQIGYGVAVPVLIAIVVGIVMTFVARRTRFGRYVFAIGGNPEAAELAGINTRWVLMKVFMLMGALAALGAAISTARLNAATNALGTLDELYVIAAAVIGGTSLAGGAGTIIGAMLGALVMQSLQSGMVLLGVDSPLQSIVVGIVLVVAVWIDTVYRRRAG